MKRVLLEGAGWLLVAGGIAALVLPGPGLLGLAAGLALLSQQYEWARRRLEPVKRSAVKTASQSVQTWPRVLASGAGAAVLIGLGVIWIVHPDAPDWWPIDDRWWLIGGWGAGATFILSGLVALGLIGYSFRRFRIAEET